MKLPRQNALAHFIGPDLPPERRAEIIRRILRLAEADEGRPAFDVHAIPRDQRAALTWRLRDILAISGIDSAFVIRGALLALVAELEGASAASVAPLLEGRA